MKTFFRIILTFLAFIASNYFIYWLPFSLIAVPRIIAQILSLIAALCIGFFVWKKLGSIPEKSIQEENPQEKSTLAIVRIFMIPLFIISYYAINLALLPLVPGINEIKFLNVLISFLISFSTCFFLWWMTENATKELLNYILIGGIATGSIGFILGFFGPIFFAPDANQGPLLGIFITGPLGFVSGLFIGGIVWFIKKRKFIQQNNYNINQQQKRPRLSIIIAGVLFFIGLILISVGYIMNQRAGVKIVMQLTPDIFSQQENNLNNLPTQKEKNLIEGEWFPLNIGNNNLGVGIIFSSDNKALFEYGVFDNFKYKVEDHSLTYMFSDSTKTPNSTYGFGINGSLLTIAYPNKKVAQELLSGGGSHNGIIGRWVHLGDSGIENVVYFTDSQDVYSLMRKNFINGTYEIKDNTIEISGTIKETWRWSVENNVLTLITKDGKKIGKYMKMGDPYL
jgi:hypothetical protein